MAKSRKKSKARKKEWKLRRAAQGKIEEAANASAEETLIIIVEEDVNAEELVKIDDKQEEGVIEEDFVVKDDRKIDTSFSAQDCFKYDNKDIKNDEESNCDDNICYNCSCEYNLDEELNMDVENDEESDYDEVYKCNCEYYECLPKCNSNSNTSCSVVEDVHSLPKCNTNNNAQNVVEDVQQPSSQSKRDNICDYQSENRVVAPRFFLTKFLEYQKEHSKFCRGWIYPADEVKMTGFYSHYMLKCDVCMYSIDLPTHPDKHINTAAVLGTISSGGTYSTLQHIVGVMNIKNMTHSTFQTLERKIMTTGEQVLLESMEEAAREERKIALAENPVMTGEDEAVGIIAIADGGWSKRSYGHTFNAQAGAGVIIGKETGKVLHLGVRNNYCVICKRAENKGVAPLEHKCYKNWTGSSGGMEADIILQGFNESISAYNLKYTKIVADGDSSMFARIRAECSYGSEVTKIECKNHATKNYGKALYKLKKSTAVPLAARKLLTVQKLKELQKEIQNALQRNENGSVDELNKQLSHGPRHVFGNHELCSQWCEKAGSISPRWTIVKNSGVILHVEKALDNIHKKAHQLLANLTSNKAECFMSLLCKYNAGKRKNLSQRCSFQGRAIFAALQLNLSMSWIEIIWQRITSMSPGLVLEKHIAVIKNSRESSRKRKAALVTSREHIKRRRTAAQFRDVEQIEYGPNAIQAPLTSQEIETEKKRLKAKMQESCRKKLNF